ncbi:MAG: DUF4332 domain-containing protein [Muribaculum sp.]|nr:DUF4332 domain-containing protein [Muribaculum sp.]
MSYKIDEIEGIGGAYAEKLAQAGVTTIEQLLDCGKTPKGRDELAERTGISGKLILKWVNHADLFRIRGVAGQFAELLEAAGVDTVKELRHRIPANLYAKLVETNDVKNLCNRVPSEKEIERMVDQAKQLPPVVEY